MERNCGMNVSSESAVHLNPSQRGSQQKAPRGAYRKTQLEKHQILNEGKTELPVRAQAKRSHIQKRDGKLLDAFVNC